MPFRQAVFTFRQGAEPAHALRQAFPQHICVARAADTVGEDAGKGQAGSVSGKAMSYGAEGLCHLAGIDQCHDRDAEADGDIGGGRLAVEQAHDALDQDQVALRGSPGQPPARIGFAAHAEIEVLTGAAGCEGVDLRIEKVRAAFEDGDAPALSRVQAGEGGGDGGLALAGGGGSDEKGGAGGHGWFGRIRRVDYWSFPPARE